MMSNTIVLTESFGHQGVTTIKRNDKYYLSFHKASRTPSMNLNMEVNFPPPPAKMWEGIVELPELLQRNMYYGDPIVIPDVASGYTSGKYIISIFEKAPLSDPWGGGFRGEIIVIYDDNGQIELVLSDEVKPLLLDESPMWQYVTR